MPETVFSILDTFFESNRVEELPMFLPGKETGT